MLDSWIILQERVNYLEDGKNVFRLRLRLCSSLYPISERIRDFFLEYDRHVLRTSPPWGSELLEVCFLSLYCCYLFLSFIKWTMKSTSQPTLYKNKIKAKFEEVKNSLANCDLNMKPSVCRGWNTGKSFRNQLLFASYFRLFKTSIMQVNSRRSQVLFWMISFFLLYAFKV